MIRKFTLRNCSSATAVLFFIATYVGLTVSNSALAQPTTIIQNFEDYSPFWKIEKQYKGVVFADALIVMPMAGTASGTRALSSGDPDNREFHTGPLIINFATGQQSVRFFVGRIDHGQYEVQAIVRAYDGPGNLVYSNESQPIKLAAGPTEINTEVSISVGTPIIRRVELQYDGTLFEVIDDLEYELDVVPSVDTKKPRVAIKKPKDNETIRSTMFQIEGTLIDDVDIVDAYLLIESPHKPDQKLQLYFKKDPNAWIYGPPQFVFGGATLLGLLTEGANTLRVVATDSSGNIGEHSIRVESEKPPTTPLPMQDIFPTAMEISQGTTDGLQIPFKNVNFTYYVDSHLVAGKRTLVRIYSTVKDRSLPPPTPSSGAAKPPLKFAAKPPLKGVRCELTGQRNGVDLPNSPLKSLPEDIEIYPDQTIADQRGDLNRTCNFELPSSWITSGVTTLIAHVNPPTWGTGEVDECATCNNFLNKIRVLGITFKEVVPVTFYPLRTCVRKSASDPKTKCKKPDTNVHLDVFSAPQSNLPPVMPVNEANIKIKTPPNPIMYVDGDFDHGGDQTSKVFNNILTQVQGRRIHDMLGGWIDLDQLSSGPIGHPVTDYFRPAINHIYVGITSECTADCGKQSGMATVVKVNAKDLARDSLTVAHEVFHVWGRGHVPHPHDSSGNYVTGSTAKALGCGELPDKLDVFYPSYGVKHVSATGKIYSLRPSVGQWGVDLGKWKSGKKVVNDALKDPASTYDLMSYCGGGIWKEWISPYTRFETRYKLLTGPTIAGLPRYKLKEEHRIEFGQDRRISGQRVIKLVGDRPVSSSGEVSTWLVSLFQLAQAQKPKEEGEYLLVSGNILSGTSASFNPFYSYTLPRRGSVDGGEGEYRIEFFGPGASSLSTFSFNPHRVADSDSDHSAFALLLPFPSRTKRIVLARGQKELVERKVSANAPETRVISPNGGERWGDEAVQTIRWKANDPDGDHLRHTVQYSRDGGATWATIAVDLTDDELDISPRLVPGSKSALVRVLTTDGVLTASDTSDRSFNVTSKRPIARITYPETGSAHVAGHMVPLLGTATDLEDRSVANKAFRWTSNRDGMLGRGRRLDAFKLSPGAHDIRLDVSDADGNVSSDQISITIKSYPIGLKLVEAAANGVCDSYQSHTIRLRWRVSGGKRIVKVGPLSLVRDGVLIMKIDEKFPLEGSAAFPVSLPLGGRVDVLLGGRGEENIPVFAKATVAFPKCAETQVRDSVNKEEYGWCCIKHGLQRSSAKTCRDLGGVLYQRSGAAERSCQ